MFDPFRRLAAVKAGVPLLALAFVSLFGLTLWLVVNLYPPAQGGVDINNRPIGQDFVNIWSGPYFAFHGRMQLLFQPGNYTEAIGERFGHKVQLYGWSYPPHTLLLYAPFSVPPYFVSLCLWTMLGIATWLAIYRAYAGRLDIVAVAMLLASPACAMNVIDGQNGFFAAALFIGGLLLADRRPVLAGVLFGILTFKPQVGIILPFALVAMRQWTVIASAAVTLLLFAGLSVLVFGIDPWIDYVTITGPRQLGALLTTRGLFTDMEVAPLVGLLVLGMPGSIAVNIQMLITLLAVGISCQIVRRTGNRLDRIAVLCSAVPLVSPYLLDYDLCLLTVPLTARLLAPGRQPVRFWIDVGAWLVPTAGLVLALTGYRPLQALAPLFLLLTFAATVMDIERRREGDLRGTNG